MPSVAALSRSPPLAQVGGRAGSQGPEQAKACALAPFEPIADLEEFADSMRHFDVLPGAVVERTGPRALVHADQGWRRQRSASAADQAEPREEVTADRAGQRLRRTGRAAQGAGRAASGRAVMSVRGPGGAALPIEYAQANDADVATRHRVANAVCRGVRGTAGVNDGHAVDGLATTSNCCVSHGRVAKKPQCKAQAFQACSRNNRNQRWKITATAPAVAFCWM